MSPSATCVAMSRTWRIGSKPDLINSRKGFAGDEFHRHIVARAVAAEFVDRDNVGMVERGGGFSFLLEAEQALGVGGECGGENFDGDAAFEARIDGVVDLAHAAGAKRGDDLEWADVASGFHAARLPRRVSGLREFHFGKKGGTPPGICERVRKSLRMCVFEIYSFWECGEC